MKAMVLEEQGQPLRLEEIVRIVDLMVHDLQARLAERRIGLELTARAREHVAREGYDPVYGARPLRRFIQRQLETPLARMLVSGELKAGGRVSADVDGESLVLETDQGV